MSQKILVIDDEEDIVALIRSRLTAGGFSVVTAGDGQEGLDKLKAERPQLVIADVTMPKVDGFTFVIEAKKLEEGKDVPIIILTGKDQMEDIFKMEGVKDYLVKPFDGDVMMEKIKKVLS